MAGVVWRRDRGGDPISRGHAPSDTQSGRPGVRARQASVRVSEDVEQIAGDLAKIPAQGRIEVVLPVARNALTVVVVLIFHPGFPAAGDLSERVSLVHSRELVVGYSDLHVVEQIF
jgi:hypothetical protein